MIPTLSPEPRLLDKLRNYWFMRRWKKSTVGRALSDHTQNFFYGEGRLRYFDQATKDKLIGDFHQQIFLLPSAPDPFLQFRKHLASCVVGYASLQVLGIKPEEKAVAFYGHAKLISGELYRHIRACVDHNEELREILWENPDITDDDLVEGASTRAAVWLYYANGLNLVRPEFGETIGKGKDWYRPYVASAMVIQEEAYRRAIGLPSFTTPETSFRPFEHSTFMTWVAQGERNPLYAWEKHYGLKHAESI